MNENNPYFHVISALSSLRSLEGLNVLDIGCGREKKYQILDEELAKRGCVVTGIDIDCKTQKISENLRFIKCPAEQIDAKIKGAFDAVISAYFFGYVTDDWNMKNYDSDTKTYEKMLMSKIHSKLAGRGLSVHYMREKWKLEKHDLENLGFHIIKFPSWTRINPLEDGICILEMT